MEWSYYLQDSIVVVVGCRTGIKYEIQDIIHVDQDGRDIVTKYHILYFLVFYHEVLPIVHSSRADDMQVLYRVKNTMFDGADSLFYMS